VGHVFNVPIDGHVKNVPHNSYTFGMLPFDQPALILAPMEGVTDAPMREVQGASGAFTFAVSEFLRVSQTVPPKGVFLRHVPELKHGCRTANGLPVAVQILGGHAGRMAEAAVVAHKAGAAAIDINFGCPAPTVNRHDGGATLLKYPERIREIVRAVRDALPASVPVSAKLRLGWDSIDAIHLNAEMATEGGAAWITIHARTRVAGYAPPVHWGSIGQVRERSTIPVVANGDIWTIEDFRQCREETGCRHFMIGRGALANPRLPMQIAFELGLTSIEPNVETVDWPAELMQLVEAMRRFPENSANRILCRVKQWLSMAAKFGDFGGFDAVKRASGLDELFERLEASVRVSRV